MVERVVLFALLCMAKGVFFVIEQPRGSSLWVHPRFQWLIKHFDIHRASFNMASFGSDTVKPTWLWSAHKCIQYIGDFAPASQRRTTDARCSASAKATTISYVQFDGTRAVDGGPDLKPTQANPDHFGRALVSLHRHYYEEIKAEHVAMMRGVRKAETRGKLGRTSKSSESWPRARIDSVMRALNA